MFIKRDLFFYLLIFLIFCLGISQGEAQSVSGVLRDKETKATIPFADIMTSGNYGVITNKNGEFTIQTRNLRPTDSLVFSSMGYQRKSVVLKDFDQEIVYLSPSVNQLEDVYVVNKKLNPLEILQKVRDNASENYESDYRKYSIFKRKSEAAHSTKYDVDLKRASFINRKKRKRFNAKLKQFTEKSNLTSHSYEDSYFNLYHGDDDAFKLNQILATKLVNREKQFSSKGLLKKVVDLIGEKLKDANTFKVRSGIIPLKDSLDIKKYLKEKDSLKTDERKKAMVLVFQKYNLSTNPHFEFIVRPKNYQYALEKITSYNGELVYDISFKPKEDEGKFKGKLYVSTQTFAVLKLNYVLTEAKGTPGVVKFLLGIKHETNAKSGQVAYQKNEEGKYALRYVEVSSQERLYWNRRLALIENSAKPDRIKLKTKIHVDIDQNIETQYLFVKSEKITESEFDNFIENSGISVKHIQEYDPEIWEKYNIIAPDVAIRKFDF